MNAALELFVTKGFLATTMDDVRRRSGASIGSIYHHFGSKEDLAAALYVEDCATTRTATSASWSAIAAPKLPSRRS